MYPLETRIGVFYVYCTFSSVSVLLSVLVEHVVQRRSRKEGSGGDGIGMDLGSGME